MSVLTLSAASWLTRPMKVVSRIIVLTAALWPSSGFGAPTKVLAVPYQALDAKVSAQIAAQTTTLIQNEVAQSGAIAVVVASLATNDVEVKDADAQVRAALARGRDAMEDGEFDAAVRSARAAIGLVDRWGAFMQDHAQLSSSYLLAGVALFRDGREDEADEMLGWAAHFAPERRLDPNQYPPIFIRAYDRARQRVLRQERGRVDIRGPRGRVLFDGKSVGSTPVVLTDVLPGPHWVRVEASGEARRIAASGEARPIVVRSKATVRVDLNAPTPPSGLAGAIQRNQMNPVNVDALRQQARKAKASHILVGTIHSSSTAFLVRSVLIEAKDGAQARRLTPIAFDLDMLTAEVEVFKLARDLGQVVAGARRAAPIESERFAIALDYAPPRPPVVADAKPRQVTAAPALPDAKDASFNVAQKPVVKQGATLIPKDEIAPSVVPPTTEAAKAKETDDDRSNLTWLWITLGVLAAAGAGAGAFVLARDGSADEGTLNIRW
ncbi:MAG: PEGA domain-containing protein [Myxococcota bacterium]